MSLELETYIALPENVGKGGFDHADVHAATDALYLAHTSNDAFDVIDCERNTYVESIPGVKAVAPAPVSHERDLARGGCMSRSVSLE
jgi:hypothetical protein